MRCHFSTQIDRLKDLVPQDFRVEHQQRRHLCNYDACVLEREVCEAPPPPTLHMLLGSHTLWLENLLEMTKQQCVGHRAHLCPMICAQCQKCLFHHEKCLFGEERIYQTNSITVGGPSVHFPPQIFFVGLMVVIHILEICIWWFRYKKTKHHLTLL